MRSPRPEPPAHSYALFVGGAPAGRLEWHGAPRPATGWYLVVGSAPPERLRVDATIAELAADTTTPSEAWALTAELTAILSTPLALDAAERRLHRRPQRQTGRFRRLHASSRVEIYVRSLDAQTLAHAIPELAVESVADVSVLSGVLLPETFERIARRVALLGGHVVAVFRDEDSPP